MKKTKLFVILIVSLIIGTSFTVFTPTTSMAKAVTTSSPRGYITSPVDGATVSGTVTIRLSTSTYIYIDGVRVTKKVTSYSWDTTSYDDGIHEIKVKIRRTTEIIHVTVDNGGTPPPPPPPPQGDKCAVLAGISNYKAISDLSYCDEDVNDWFNYLISIGYQSENIIVLGDHTSSYVKYDGLATEYNIKFYVNWLINLDCDEIAFITSGHGGGDGNGNSFNCAWDCGSGENGEDGYLDDYEFEAMFTGVLAPKVFVFMDHCYSGGMIPEFYDACGNKLYMTTTCTEDGYGWDVGTYKNGAWTYYFLEYALINHFGSNPTTAMEDAFDYASASYPYGGGDTPQEGDYYPGDFTL
jgi:hypothetical protein